MVADDGGAGDLRLRHFFTIVLGRAPLDNWGSANGGRDLLLPLLAAENELPYGPRVPLYLLELLWLFLGVAIVADIFMAAIEQITSQEKKVTLMVRGEWTSYSCACGTRRWPTSR